MIILTTRTNDAHADVLVERLNEKKADFLRLNWDDFPQRIKINLDFDKDTWQAQVYLPLGRVLDCQSVTAGWCRSQPSARVSQSIEPPFARRIALQESETTIQDIIFLLSDRYWINHPQQMRVAYSKLFQLKIAQEVGFRIPRTRVTNSPELFSEFYSNISGDKITKMIGLPWRLAEDGYLVFTNVLKPENVQSSELLELCPTLIQEFVEKDIELRVTVVGNDVFAMEIHSKLNSESEIDWRRITVDDLKKIGAAAYFPDSEAQRCIQFLSRFGLVYGAFDFILTPKGDLVFLEMNPHGAWGFVEYITGLPISYAIVERLMAQA